MQVSCRCQGVLKGTEMYSNSENQERESKAFKSEKKSKEIRSPTNR